VVSASPLPAAGLSTAGLRLRIAATPHLRLDLDLLPPGDPLLKAEAARACPIALTTPGTRLTGDDFVVTSVYTAPDAIAATCVAGEIEARLSWQTGARGAIHMLVQLRVTEGETPRDGELRLPMLDHLHPGPPDRTPAHDAGLGPLGRAGRALVRARRFALPHSWWSDRGGVAVLARYAQDTQEESRWQPLPTSLPVRMRSAWLDACELVFVACAPGWLGSLDALRGQMRAGVDLSEYRRPDLQWYRQQWLQHFTFLYGGEIFDHARQRFDLDRLLEDGRRFGGYDGLLLWPQYPRLGVDERDQWAFYDDLPGGREGLRALAEQARAGGTRVFIPYLPWDTPPAVRHGEPPHAARQLARVVAEMGADGVFLDTMDSVLPAFRREIDRVRPGVVFCSEGQPDLSAIALITGSWDQARHDHAGEVDLARFLIPEHPSFMINRHAIGMHRERVIARALWNGTGLVVWQDVFGEMLPYSAREAAQVRTAITLLRRYAHCFRGGDALPLISTAHPDLLANAFIAADGRAVLTVLNDGDEAISGDLVTWSHHGARGWRAVGDEARGDIHATPRGTIAPGQVAVYASVPDNKAGDA
jgi:hypothetical protein